MRQLILKQLTTLGLAFGLCVARAATGGPGQEFQLDAAAITVIYVNGIANDPGQTTDASDTLIASLETQGLPGKKYSFDYFYNATEGRLADDTELLDQARISDAFLGASNGDRTAYYQALGAFYNSQYATVGTLSGTRYRVIAVAGRLKQYIETTLTTSGGVVLVPHSQGNFYVEAAYAMMLAEGKAELLKRIRVSGVASVAATSPSNRYVTHSSDRAIIALNAQTHEPLAVNLSYYFPLIANEVPCIGSFCGDDISLATWAFIDVTGHGFVNVYLNQGISSQSSRRTFPRIIYDMVVASLVEIEDAIRPPLPPANPITLLDNLGDRQFCTISGTGFNASISCSGEAVGLIPALGPFPRRLFVRAAVAVDAPASCPCDVTTFELPVYLSSGDDSFFVTFRRDIGGVPDQSAVGVVAGFSFSGMRTVSSFLTNPPFTTISYDVAPTLVPFEPGHRYWVEVSAPNTTRAVWPSGRTGANALVAESRDGNPYTNFGTISPAPALRIVVTPK